MNIEDVPQHAVRALEGQAKVLYARDADGTYRLVPSTGWEPEQIVLAQALEDLDAQARDAFARARRGETSPLEYHMLRQRLDLAALAQAVGMMRWRVRRHLRPGVFSRLPARLRERYAEALGMPATQLDRLPDTPE